MKLVNSRCTQPAGLTCAKVSTDLAVDWKVRALDEGGEQ